MGASVYVACARFQLSTDSADNIASAGKSSAMAAKRCNEGEILWCSYLYYAENIARNDDWEVFGPAF